MTVRDCLFASPSSLIRNEHLFLMTGLFLLNRHHLNQHYNALPNQLFYARQRSGLMPFPPPFLLEKVEEMRSNLWGTPRVCVIIFILRVFPI